MKICFMGSMDFAVTILEGLHQKYGVDLVVTQPDKPVGRKKVIQGTPVRDKALELGIELFQPKSIRKDNLRILKDDFDLIIVAAYGQIIPEEILYHGKYQAINVHASLLPKYRGGSPMHKAIINGDKISGVSIIFMEKKLDSGDILAQRACEITEEENVLSLERKLSVIGRDLLLETLEILFLGKVKAIKQNIEEVTYAFNFKNEDLIIDFNKSAKDIYNFIRGLNPWPISYFEIDGKKLKVFESSYLEENLSSNVGEVVKISKDGLFIQTKQGIINLKRVQLEGKKEMDINSFMNGAGKSLFTEGQILI
ncbi:MAG: methionyl-tRNA formyltransferase [Candidatus Izemoplasmatales bacterium]|nr:methionyl-tRNA formyltransferase [Candidatus Izemoplasmatales bacterium]